MRRNIDWMNVWEKGKEERCGTEVSKLHCLFLSSQTAKNFFFTNEYLYLFKDEDTSFEPQ